ncbi:FAD-dependent oxidoreductase [Vibrio sp.]|uniref:flavin monoamine oxidase family protein n=1 Tax=Vibrio sp. TaxID=678 RepID=UPI00311E4B07
MKKHQIAILGGGLSGLYTAYLLEQHGINNYCLIEAAPTLGGRILTQHVSSNNVSGTFDLGPSWFWPEFQPQFSELIDTLNLRTFEQFNSGKIVVERSPNEEPITLKGMIGGPNSMRLKGGMSSLISALSMTINRDNIILNHRVTDITKRDDSIDITCHSNKNLKKVISAEQIFLALPPRLLSQSIDFTPMLPEKTIKQWQATPTWMAPHAKYIAVFEDAFWRKKGLSGDARSVRGPLVEIHDASSYEGMPALFGFIGVPAHVRKDIDQATLMLHCRAQIERLFGPNAPEPKYEFMQDWSKESRITTELDLTTDSSHGLVPEPRITTGDWQNRIIGVGSEWSKQFPGLLAGAVEAAENGVRSYLSQTNHI